MNIRKCIGVHGGECVYPKEGDMGFRDLCTFNLAMLAKQI
jgi:hypothetical protein